MSFECKALGLLGFIKFTAGYYAILIEDTDLVGKIMCHEIYEVRMCKLIKLFNNNFVSNKKRENRYFKDHIKKYLNNEKPSFFFSYTYDMTSKLQDNFLFSLKEKAKYKKFYESQGMPIFQWNHFPKKCFEKATGIEKSDKWILRMIHGSFEQMNLKLYSYTMSVCLIGRRLVQNAGTRYNKRGLNAEVIFTFFRVENNIV